MHSVRMYVLRARAPSARGPRPAAAGTRRGAGLATAWRRVPEGAGAAGGRGAASGRGARAAGGARPASQETQSTARFRSSSNSKILLS